MFPFNETYDTVKKNQKWNIYRSKNISNIA